MRFNKFVMMNNKVKREDKREEKRVVNKKTLRKKVVIKNLSRYL